MLGHRDADEEREEGMTLIELIVAMGIFTLIIAIFMGGLVIMTKSTVRSQVTSDSGDALRTVLQRFDQQVRYAESINLPGEGPSGARYVEYRTKAVEAGEIPTCTQWRYLPGTGELQTRTWPDTASATLPAWRTSVTDVRDETTATLPLYPFEVQLADEVYTRQRLTVTLAVGESELSDGASVSSTYVARNSSVQSLSNADADGDGTSDTQVCITSGGRP